MKILFIILDGLGDRPIKELGDKTPLEAAKTPNFDFLASQGICGLIEPVYQGKFPTSKDAHLSLFGYDLKKWGMARGVFEVLGIGMELGKEDIALRGNFSTVDSNFKIVDRRAGRISDTKPLIKALQGRIIEGVKFLLAPAVSHRLGIILRGRNLSDKISDGDFHKANIRAPKIRPLEKSPEARFTARVLNKFLLNSHQILKNHPLNKKRIKKGQLAANYILVREAGKLKKLQSFEKKWRMKACCIAGGVLYKGIAKVLGMDLIKVKGATGKANTDLEAKFKAAKNSLKRPAPYRNEVSGAGYDFCYLHIKATDNFSHDGDFLGKKKFIEKIDRNLPIFLDLKDVLITITGDHSTPCGVKEHTADPLPVLVFGLPSGARGKKRRSFFALPSGARGKKRRSFFALPSGARGKKRRSFFALPSDSEGGRRKFTFFALEKDGVHPPQFSSKFGRVKKFSEKECQKGKIGKIKSTDFMRRILTCNF